MTYDVILFTDCNTRLYHAKTLGVHRIATELRNHGYSVKVLDFLGEWLKEPATLFQLLKTIIGPNTLFVGFSGVFLSDGISKSPKSFKEYAYGTWSGWPASQEKKKIFFQALRRFFPHVKLVYGGINTDFQISFVAQDVDYIIKGLADTTIIELADHLSKGTPLKYMLKNGTKIIDYDTKALGFNFAHSRVDYVPEDNIMPGQVLPIETSRGCLFKCAFCDFPLIGRKKGDPDYHKTVDIMAQELRYNWENYQVNRYMIVDDTFNETTGKIENLLRARDLAGVDFRFSAFIRADLIGRYPEQIKLLSELGMVTCILGIETFDAESGKAIGKSTAPERMKEILYQMKDQPNPPQIQSGFIIGLPNDNPETLDRWIPWLDDPSCPIDKIHTNTLQLLDTSDISLHPEKYGYTIIDQEKRVWKNKHWTQHDADAYMTQWQTRWWDNSRLRPAGWEYMGFIETGYTEEYLKNVTLDQFDWDDVNAKRHAKWLRYRDLVLDYELK
jgi:radical SAM superfamily enzyme YgiQ (UPF0313 family)